MKIDTSTKAVAAAVLRMADVAEFSRQEMSEFAALLKAVAAERDNARNRIAELEQDADRYAWLRARDLDTIQRGGVFAGMVPEGGGGGGAVLNGEDLDHAIDAAMCLEMLTTYLAKG